MAEVDIVAATKEEVEVVVEEEMNREKKTKRRNPLTNP